LNANHASTTAPRRCRCNRTNERTDGSREAPGARSTSSARVRAEAGSLVVIAGSRVERSAGLQCDANTSREAAQPGEERTVTETARFLQGSRRKRPAGSDTRRTARADPAMSRVGSDRAVSALDYLKLRTALRVVK
jgi:hypothetical protein